MPLTETDIISRFFQQPGLCSDPLVHKGIPLGIGDDCALLGIPPGQQLAVSIDTLVENVHFPADADPFLLAQRALAVNLSDLAAMGAAPLGFTLALTLAKVDEDWLKHFSSGLRESTLRHGCPLFGGNLAQGPLQICIQVHGTVPSGMALLRSGAKPGDDVYMSGWPGRAGLALRMLQGKFDAGTEAQREELTKAYYQPEPRLALGQALRGIANAAQDVSDGVLRDLGHIARASRVGMRVEANAVPLAPVLGELCGADEALVLALTAGDDYELVFTASPGQRARVSAAAASANTAVSRIGEVTAGSVVEVVDASGRRLQPGSPGYDHFSAADTGRDK